MVASFKPQRNNEVVPGQFEVHDEWIAAMPEGWEELLREMRKSAYDNALTFFIYYDRMRCISVIHWVPADHPYRIGVWKQAIQ